MPTVGAFVLTYRRPAALRASIEGLLAQSRRPDLVLVVDNAQEDEAADLVAGFASEDVVYEATSSNLGSAGGTAFGTSRLTEMACDLIHFDGAFYRHDIGYRVMD